MECVLIFLHSMLTLVSTDELSHRVAKVYTRRSKQTTEARCLRFWNTSVRWECDYYALLYDADAASLPVILPDGRPPSLHAIYRKAVALIEDRQRSVHAEPGATERVVEAIGQGLLDQQKVAASMGISVATLRRRLLEEGASFRKVRRQTLNANAKSLLEHRHHVSEVADTLGFSDFRSFNRAFKSWNGVTPCVYAARYLQSRR
jgi:AraC-like DNA-binding protein